MGTDIHGVLQAKIGGEWKDIANPFSEDRHYMLFAWLGNVRNGFGFAGSPTHEPLEPLSDCRGFPEDFEVNGEEHPIDNIDVMAEWSRNYVEEGKPLEVWMGDHSFSWVSSKEVLEAELPSVIRHGIISKEQYLEWDGVSQPNSWSGGISGSNINVDNPGSITGSTTHVAIKWRVSVKDELGYFIEEIKKQHDEYGEVRYVFGFDS